jgi:hypothetical protein
MGSITNPKGIAPPRAKKHVLNSIYCDLSPKLQTDCSLMNRQHQRVVQPSIGSITSPEGIAPPHVH